MDIDVNILKMFMGILAALIWGAVGYAVAKKGGDNFEPANFGKTVLIGFILGLISMAVGVETTEVEGYTILQVIVIIVDKLVALIEKPVTPTPVPVAR